MSLNFALVIDGNASGGKRAANEVTVAVQDLGREVRNTSANMQAAANANRQAETSHRAATEAIRGETAAQRDLTAAILQFAGVRAPTADSGLAARQADLDAYGSALDQIRAKHVPLFAVQRQYGEQLEEIAAAARVGAISEDERAAAAMRAKAAYDLQIMSLTRGGASTKLAAHEIQNLSFQVNDIAMMLMSGQSFGIIMAQQGGQIAQIFGKRGLASIMPELAAGIASLISPTTLALAAITALCYGAEWAFSSMQEEVASTDDVLKRHDETIRAINDAWNVALQGPEKYASRSRLLLSSVARQNLVAVQAAARQEGRDFFGEAGTIRNRVPGGGDFAVSGEFRPFDEALRQLRRGVIAGKPDFDAFWASINQKVTSEPGLRVLGDRLILLSQDFFETDRAAKEAAKAVEATGRAAAQAAERFDTYMASLGRLREGNQNPLSAIEEAERDYARAAGSANSREERDDAYDAYQRRLQRIREAQEIAQLQAGGGFPMPAPNREDALPSASDVLRGQDERIQFLQLEAQLIGASDQVRARLMARLEAEQDLRRRGIDLQSEEARSIIANAEAIAESEVKIDRAAQAWERWRSAGEDAIDGVVDRLLEGDLAGVLEGLGKDAAKYAVDMLIKNPSKNAAYNSGLPTMEDAGGIMGLLARMFGGADKTAESAIGAISGQTVASMNVTAATVMINGGIGGLVGGDPAANVTKLLSPANSNDPNVGSTIDFMRAGGKAGVGPDYNVANATAFIRQYAEQIGIDPDIALRVARSEGLADGVWQSNLSRNGFREPSYGPFQLLKGGAGTGYGTGLGNAFLRQTGLDPADPANWQASTAFALQQAKQGGWGPWFGARDQGITGFMGIDRNAPNVDPAEVLKSFQSTSDAVSKLGKVALPASENLDVFGSSLGDMGKSLLGGLGSGGGGGGGVLDWIMKLLGGIPGFAGGTEGAPEGWAWVGENGRELKRLRQGDVIRSAPRSQQMVAESQVAASLAAGRNHQAVAPLLIPQKQTIVHNYAGDDVTSTQESDGEGGVREEIFIERKVAAAIARPGSAANRQLRAGGFKPRRARR
ncbi:phage tail length tape measure family protein [Mesorhizobium sp. J428]|uniref:phage tail length tape measure family protein n=1 Tax=Mesorhizobium sp. J428 TaxID=2898440 RepID=UPI00215152BB|nr:phage tail length tape measure family protein [Mesorhizobium sp. J428]MCR5855998.1 phage tail length tape measure family protein [Mesorhizobium sp. J428]